VLDASRAVDVVSQLLSPAQRTEFIARTRADQQHVREQHASLKQRPIVPWPAAQANSLRLEWHQSDVAQPRFTGARVLDDVGLEDLVPYIDWTFFFTAWELKGRFPAILDHPQYGPAARDLYDNARSLLDRIVKDRLLTPRGVYGFWPANAADGDIVIYDPRQPPTPKKPTSKLGVAELGIGSSLLRFNMLRQQEQMPDGTPNLSLADFVAPAGSGITDYIGAFAVTAGHGAAELAAAFERDHDDYHAIIVKALADRLAEAFAEYLHAQVRKEWGYGVEEKLTHDDLVAEKYRGIRPAFGYPACPDHSEKGKLFELLGAERAGVELTESYAMTPAASVSGIYLAHPAARYFTVGRIGRDQVEDYARRKGIGVADVERWLTPNLGYELVGG
jgi:5-methyltetrahydrofolate--homocysteine methyltransferase